MVFYRKYRPQKIEELDSKEIREKLQSVLSGSVPHAFLFTGPKGLGKTSAARIVAKAINCEATANKKQKTTNKKSEVSSQKLAVRSEGIEPCNKCSQCVSITNGTNIDVLEIDGASNRGIDEIRDLREKIRLSPAYSSKKVYIIDEVHMLTAEAFNALLKTLEEPPSHALFILCTTQQHKIPPTIVSRCFHIAFKKASKDELVSSFKRIVKGEKLDIDKEVLGNIANLSDGSFRDGAKILEEMVGQARGKKITQELIEQKYQIRNLADQISQLVKLLSDKDSRKALELVGKLADQGMDMKYFLEQLISSFHLLMLKKIGVEQDDELSTMDFKLEINDIKDLINLLGKAYTELKYAVLPQLPLELVIVEWSLSSGRLPHVADDARLHISEKQTLNATSLSKSRLPPEPMPTFNSSASGQAPDLLRDIIDKVKTQNHSVAGVLRGCRIARYDKDELVIETGFKFHKERLEDKNAMGILEKAISEIAGRKIEVSVLLKEVKRNV